VSLSPEVETCKKVNLTKEEAEKLFDKLFNEKEFILNQRIQLEKEFYSKFTFSPDILDKTKPSVISFFKRLQEWIQKKTEKEIIEIEKANFDDKTGQLLFSPIISRISKEKNNRDVWSELFHEKVKMENKKKETLSIQEKAFDVRNSIKLISYQSEEIIKQLKSAIFKKLFDCLDIEQKKSICYKDITSNENISEDIISLLDGIKETLKDNDTQLSEADFIKAVEEIDEVMKYQEKTKLFLWYHNEKLCKSPQCTKNTENVKKYSFSPEINKRSTSLYNESKRHEKDFFQRNFNSIKIKEDYINTKRQEKETLELKECTFSPKISRKNGSLVDKQTKSTIGTATIVSKNTLSCTHRTGDLKSSVREEDKKNDFKTINIDDKLN